MSKSIRKKVMSTALVFGILLSSTSVSAAQEETSGGKTLSNDDVTPFSTSERVGGGIWTYDVYKHGWLNRDKTVYSQYWHPDEVHGSSTTLGSRTPVRDCVAKDKTSNASMTARTNDTAYVWWNKSCSL